MGSTYWETMLKNLGDSGEAGLYRYQITRLLKHLPRLLDGEQVYTFFSWKRQGCVLTTPGCSSAYLWPWGCCILHTVWTHPLPPPQLLTPPGLSWSNIQERKSPMSHTFYHCLFFLVCKFFWGKRSPFKEFSMQQIQKPNFLTSQIVNN